MWVKSGGLFVLIFLEMSAVRAQDLEQQKAALKAISETANEICTKVPIENETKNVELTGDAKAKLAGVIGKVVDLGIEGAAKYTSGSSKGVLQKDLAEAVKKGNDCSLSVFNTLVEKMLPKKSSDASKPVVPTRFNKPSGYFLKQGKFWTEFPPYAPGSNFRFAETVTDKDYVYLVDNSRTKPGNPDNGMIIRLPLQGGSAQWSYQNPLTWTDLTIVSPAD